MNLFNKRFLLVDDDPLNNKLSKMALKQTFGEVHIKEFLEPELALEFIQIEFEHNHYKEKTTLFLDLNMPSLTGWEFLDKFMMFTDRIKNQIDIYILSSSIDPTDIDRAKLNLLVLDFIEKPLHGRIISSLL